MTEIDEGTKRLEDARSNNAVNFNGASPPRRELHDLARHDKRRLMRRSADGLGRIVACLGTD